MSEVYKVYKAMVEERENRRAWFHTPPAPEWAHDHRSLEMIELVNRVLANEEQRAKEKYLTDKKGCRSVPVERHPHQLWGAVV